MFLWFIKSSWCLFESFFSLFQKITLLFTFVKFSWLLFKWWLSLWLHDYCINCNVVRAIFSYLPYFLINLVPSNAPMCLFFFFFRNFSFFHYFSIIVLLPYYYSWFTLFSYLLPSCSVLLSTCFVSRFITIFTLIVLMTLNFMEIKFSVRSIHCRHIVFQFIAILLNFGSFLTFISMLVVFLFGFITILFSIAVFHDFYSNVGSMFR